VYKRGESLEVYWYIYGSPKNLAVGLRFKIRTMSGWPRQSAAGSFCEENLNSRLTWIGPDNVRLYVSVLDGLEKT
jgi:hypothetical protein